MTGARKAGARRVASGELRWLLAGIAVYLGLALTGLAVASVTQEMRNLVMALERSQRAEDALLAEQSRLLLERSTLTSYRNIDRLAEAELSMHFPQRVERVLRPLPQTGETPP